MLSMNSTNEAANTFGRLGFGYWGLFGIWDLDFVIYICGG